MTAAVHNTGKVYYSVAVLVFDGVDILDFAGPMEIFGHVSHNQNPDDPDSVYKLSLVAARREIVAAQSLNIKAHYSIDDLLTQDRSVLTEFDMAVVPGGPPSVIKSLLSNDGPEHHFLKAFASLPPKQDLQPRILFSVCTGALFLGALGLLTGTPCTTHHRALDVLSAICGESHPSAIMEKRYVDGGLCKSPIAQHSGLRIVTAGGISSGRDASIWLVSQQINIDIARFVARVMEYDGLWESDAARGERKPI